MSRPLAGLFRALFAVVVAGIMLVPTGMCICAERDEESQPAQHEPGCPKVRTLDRDQPPASFTPDVGFAIEVVAQPTARQIEISVPVPYSGHSPPGRPIYMVCRALLI